MAYLYRHIRLDKNEPFYVGIGSDNEYEYKRAYETVNRNQHWKNIVAQTPYEVEIILDKLTWNEACSKEIEFIALYGRTNLNEGTLCNMTNGGEGKFGLKDSAETKQKKRNSAINKPKSEQHKQNLSKALIGKNRGYCSWLVNNENRSNKIRLSKLGKPSLKKTAIIQLDKNNNIIQEFDSYTSAKNATKINGIANVLRGLAKTAGGFIWKYKIITKECA